MASSHEPPAIRVISPSRKGTPQVKTRASVSDRRIEEDYKIPSYYETDHPHHSSPEYEEVSIVRQVENGRGTIEHLPPLRTSSHHQQLKATHHRQRSDGSVTIKSPAVTPNGSKRHTRNISGPVEVSPISPDTSARPAAYDISTDPWNTPAHTTQTQQSPIDSFKSKKSIGISHESPSTSLPPQHPPLSLRVSLGIILRGLAIIIPMIALPIILIAVIYQYQLPQPTPNDTQHNIEKQQISRSHYHVQVPATVLLIMSALSGVAAVLLTRAMMSLESYRSAASLLRIVKHGQPERLPKPDQMETLMDMLRGRWSALAKSLRISSPKRRKARGPQILATPMVWFLSIVLLSILIVLADIWLHIATRSQILFVDNANNQGAQPRMLGTGIVRECQGLSEACPVSSNPDTVLSLDHETSRVRLAYGKSPHAELTNGPGSNESFVLLSQHGDTMEKSSIDSQASTAQASYAASSFAARTQCIPISQKCGLKDDKDTISFDCSGDPNRVNFSQNFSKSDIGATIQVNSTFFTDSTYSKQFSYRDVSNTSFSAPTLYHAAFFVSTERHSNAPPPDTDLVPVSLQFDDTAQSGSAFLALCNTTIYEATFLRTGTSPPTIKSTTPANISTASPALSVLVAYGADGVAYTPNLALFPSDSASDINNAYASAMARSALINLSTMTEPRPVLSYRMRRPIMVAKVPKSALFVLVGLDLVFAAVGVVMMALALGEGMRGEVVEMRRRMMMTGMGIRGGGGCWEGEKWSPRSDRVAIKA